MSALSKYTQERQLYALDVSISKWKSIVYNNGRDLGSLNCCCCNYFPNCVLCPISEYVQTGCCFNTPYIEWGHYFNANGLKRPMIVTDAITRTLANHELSFLYEVRRWLIMKMFYNKK